MLLYQVPLTNNEEVVLWTYAHVEIFQHEARRSVAVLVGQIAVGCYFDLLIVALVSKLQGLKPMQYSRQLVLPFSIGVPPDFNV